MRPRSRWNGLKYWLWKARWRLRYWWYGIQWRWEDLLDWLGLRRLPVVVGISDLKGCYSNATHRERLDLYVSAGKLSRQVEAYLSALEWPIPSGVNP